MPQERAELVYAAGGDQLLMASDTASARLGCAGRAARPATTQVTSVSPGVQKAAAMSGSHTDAPLNALAPKPIKCKALRKFIRAAPMHSHCSWAGTAPA